MNRDTLISDIKEKLVVALNMQGVSSADIETDAPLFEDGGLGLDSVDALELVVMVEREYGIVVDGKDEAKNIFASVGSLADYVIARKK